MKIKRIKFELESYFFLNMISFFLIYFKLIYLKTKFSNDNRFKIDERFIESDSENEGLARFVCF